jgi:hypothetical protein
MSVKAIAPSSLLDKMTHGIAWPVLWFWRFKPARYPYNYNDKSILEPSSLQLTFYWFAVYLAKAISDLWVIPLQVRQQMILTLSAMTSRVMGRRANSETYTSASNLASAIETDDEMKVRFAIEANPECVNVTWLGAMPLENAISNSYLRSAETLILQPPFELALA